MIVVIADDFTGAAEMGGIGIRYNLKVEVNTRVNLQSKADMLVVATDTRSMQKEEAIKHMEMVTMQVSKLNPTLLFKKVDSVLRGYVVEELLVHMRKLGYPVALLIPANPALGRTITNGLYYLNAQPLHTGNFSNDPEFPAKTSSVTALLHQKGLNIHSQKHHEALKPEGVIVGDVNHTGDLCAWAGKVGNHMLIAGASGFFTAVMDQFVTPAQPAQQLAKREFKAPMLIVSGTAFAKSAGAVKALKNSGFPVSYMPADVVKAKMVLPAGYEQWCLEIVSLIVTFGKTIIAIDPSDTEGLTDHALILRERTAAVVAMVFEHIVINELLIEGGSTASAILKQLHIEKLYPVEELATGVIRMYADNDPDLYITMKPGSYSWPESVRQYSLY